MSFRNVHTLALGLFVLALAACGADPGSNGGGGSGATGIGGTGGTGGTGAGGTGAGGTGAGGDGGGEPTPPAAFLEATPPTGSAPLEVTLDASASTDRIDSSDALMARFDVDGDGVWETELSHTLTYAFSYTEAGTYAVLAEVVNTAGLSAIATAELTVQEATTPEANLEVDSNRDGVITQIDNIDEQHWTTDHGAVFLANVDDDDRDGNRDANDSILNGAVDRQDMASLMVRKMNGLGAEHRAVLSIAPRAAAERLRLFTVGGAVVVAPGQETALLPISNLSSTGMELRIEALSGREPEWDGEVFFFLEVFDDAVSTTESISSDAVVMHVAPVILPDDTRPGEVLYVMRIAAPENGPNLPFYDALEAALPTHIRLYDVDEWDYYADRWVQDSMQTGYQMVPGVDGPRHIVTDMETSRETGRFGLEPLLPGELMSADLGYFYPGGSETSLNYGGNLEIAPPHPGHPFGRIIYGGGNGGSLHGEAYGDAMASEQVEWLAAQGMQGEPIRISTEWLAVGHVDEVILSIPDQSGTGTYGWKIVIASPDLAIAALEELSADTENGYGSLDVFAGRSVETTVDGVLADEEVMGTSELAQARIDTVQLRLMDALGLTEDDFLPVPVMYEYEYFDGVDLAYAYDPGIQNMVVADGVLFVPDPEGPDVDGQGESTAPGVWQQLTLDALEPTGNQVVFVDVFDSYHLLMGEAHCGTNFQRQPYDQPWWEVAP